MPSSNSELAWQARTAANILEARKSRGRVGSKKSRAGCIACKMRRVKCCESRPVCAKCLSTGRNCEYAEPASKVVKNTLGRHLSSSLGLNHKQTRAFDYFLSWTAPRLGGMLDREFWCGSILQFAQNEPVVLDALLAVSTLYEHPQYMRTFQGRPNYAVLRGEDRPPIDEHHEAALHHYNKAMRGFSAKVTEGSATPTLALLTCILFICIEVIRDDIFAALALFKKGDAILDQFPAGPQGTDRSLFLTIKSIFGRLSVLSAQCGVPIGLEKHALMAHVPSRFNDLDHARASLFGLMADSHVFVLEAAQYCSSLNLEGPLEGVENPYYTRFKTESDPLEIVEDRGPAQSLVKLYMRDGNAFPLRMHDIEIAGLPKDDWMPQVMKERQELCLERFELWHEAFKQTYTPGHENEAAACLLMYYHISAMFVTARLSQAQTVFDQYTSVFREVVRLAECYVLSKSAERPSFTFELGAVPPLFVVALKCRTPSLRRRAIELLHKSPGKECTFGAGSSAELAARVVAIEEEDLGLTPPPVSPAATPSSTNSSIRESPVDDTILPSEEKRVHNFELLANRSAKCFELRVTRYSETVDGRRIKTISDYPL